MKETVAVLTVAALAVWLIGLYSLVRLLRRRKGVYVKWSGLGFSFEVSSDDAKTSAELKGE